MRAKWFALGVVVTLAASSAAAYVYLEQGFVDARADVKPGVLDSWLGAAMDASTERHAPKVTNPFPDTQAALLTAAQTYRSRCVACHGGPTGGPSKLGKSFFPPAPQFFGDERPDMKENENFYIVKHGIRMTAMPAWGELLSNEQIWQTVTLLKHIDDKNIPPAVEQELSTPQR
jgi:mono/diheme cytochrome c family protein